jgi:hypothetical protein
MNCYTKLTIAFVWLVVAAVFASGQKMDFDVTPGTDFSRYKTYKWQRASDARYPADDVDQLLIRTIDSQLAGKGLTKTESDTPDLYVIYQLAIEEDMKWSSFRTDIAWAGTPVTGIYTMQGATTNSNYPVSVGSLFIDLYDVAQKRRVWQVHATKTVHPDNSAEKKEKNARKVLEKVFKNYPPK